MAQKKKTHRIGSKENSYLNNEWAGHGRPFGKKVASKGRRIMAKKEIKDRLENEC